MNVILGMLVSNFATTKKQNKGDNYFLNLLVLNVFHSGLPTKNESLLKT